MNHEPDAHTTTRHFRTGVRILLSLSLIATVICLLFFREVAYLAAIPIPVLYAVLAVTNYLEIRSRASNFRASTETELTPEEIEVDAETVGIVTLLKVLGMLAIGTFIVAASMTDWQTAGVVACGLFFLAVLIELPYLPLFFSEAKRDEREKLT